MIRPFPKCHDYVALLNIKEIDKTETRFQSEMESQLDKEKRDKFNRHMDDDFKAAMHDIVARVESEQTSQSKGAISHQETQHFFQFLSIDMSKLRGESQFSKTLA